MKFTLEIMKTILTALTILFIVLTNFAQNGINYKAVIKDVSNNLVVNQTKNMQAVPAFTTSLSIPDLWIVRLPTFYILKVN